MLLLPDLDRNHQTIHVSDEYFGMWSSEIYMNMEQYEGCTLTMAGFVYKDPELAKPMNLCPPDWP
jgi:putative membrane protein